MTEEAIGRVTHYWPRAHAAALALESAVLRVGDRIRIVGRDHDFVETVRSIELEHAATREARPGEDVAIGVDAPVRPRDVVFLLRDTGGPKE